MPQPAAWKVIKLYLEMGLNLHPIYEYDDEVNTWIQKKKPVGSEKKGTNWGRFEKQQQSTEDLVMLMDEHDTNGVAAICGRSSGNLEVADIDNKFKAGCETPIFQSIQGLYPELWDRLRIHKTTSGGYHILWRIDGHIPPAGKAIAKRLATELELAEFPKRKEYAFIEMRGQGNLATLPPTDGYSVTKDNPIPTITWEERCAIVAIFESYNEVLTVEKAPYKPPVNVYNNYSVNPFDDYNENPSSGTLLDEEGWVVLTGASNNKITYYTKPQSKSKGIHGYYNHEKKVYAIFSTDTHLFSEKAQRPSSLLSKIKGFRNGRELYQYLIDKGYGKMSAQQEAKIIDNVRKKNTPIPKNISTEAIAAITEAREVFAEAFPHGIFWEQGEKGYSINLERMFRVIAGLGFMQSEENLSLVRVAGNIVSKVSENFFYNTVKQYIAIEDEKEYFDVHDAYERQVKQYGKYIISRLPNFDESLLFKSTKTTAYKFFKNGWLTITATSTTLTPYEQFPEGKYIWSHDYINRDWTGLPLADLKKSLYYQFLELSVGVDARLMQIIGYYAHDFKDPTNVYAILITEDCDDPKKGGGTGKSTFTRLLSLTTTFQEIPGALTQMDDKLFQSWRGQRIFSISDIPKDFEFTFFKPIVEGNVEIKKLYKNIVNVPSTHTPKIIFTTQFSLDSNDGGLDRRIIFLEYKPFFKHAGGIKKYFGKMFPDQNGNAGDWTAKDFLEYDNMIIYSIQEWLAVGELSNIELSEGGWLKQFKQMHGASTMSFIEEHFERWVAAGEVGNSTFNEQLAAFYHEEGIDKKYQKSPQKLNDAIAMYAHHAGYDYEFKNVKVLLERGRRFTPKGGVARTTFVQQPNFTPIEKLPF